MFVYWLLFAFFAVGALAEERTAERMSAINNYWISTTGMAPQNTARHRSAVLVIGAAMTIFLIGMRYKVGGDWYAYVSIFDDARRVSFQTALKYGDPGFEAVNWIVGQAFGDQVWVVNLLCAIVFGWGLFRLCSVQPRPWLAFAVSIPYLVIVVAMGYQRQAVALGFLMAGLARGGSPFIFAIYCAFAAAFHSTAVVVFPLVAWSARGSPVVNAALVISIGLALYQFFLNDRMDTFVASYLDSQYSSQGALIRVSMNLLAAVIFFLAGKKLEFDQIEFKLWRNFALIAVAMLILLAFVPSTAVDRISLYLLPLQIAVISRVPLLGNRSSVSILAVLGYLLTIELVWLNYGQFARFWVPYQFYPF